MCDIRVVPLIPLVAAILAIGFMGDPSAAHADHSAPTATFAVDVKTSGNNYRADPDSDGLPADNQLVAGSVDSCVEVSDTGLRTVDIVGSDMSNVTGYDIRLIYNPSHVAISSSNHTPFRDNLDASVGFINLPWDSLTSSRRQDTSANNVDSESGHAFFAATYLDTRNSAVSADEPHAASAAEPYTAGPGGVPLVRLNVFLKPAAAGQIVTFDLTNSVAPGNDYVSFNPTSEGEEVIDVPESNLIDGAIAVAPATCSEATTPPTTASGEATPAPGTGSENTNATPAPGSPDQGLTPSSPDSGPTATPATTPPSQGGSTPATPSTGSPGPAPTDTADSAGGDVAAASDPSADDDSGGSAWPLVGIALGGALLAALAGAALVWRWRLR